MWRSTWHSVTVMIKRAPYPVMVLPCDATRAVEHLERLGMSSRSWLGAVIENSGGLLVDNGWLRVLGSGAEALRSVVDVMDSATGRLTVAYDVLGGRFDWRENDQGKPTVHYFGPEDLEWFDTGEGYGDWLEAMLSGATTGFYSAVRWPGWEQEVAAVRLDQGIHTWPPPWSAEGTDLSAVSRRPISFTELLAFHEDMAGQVRGRL